MHLHYLQKKIGLFGIFLAYTLVGSPVLADITPLSEAEKNSISTIDFSLEDENIDQFRLDVAKPALKEQVIKNLSDWQYPLKSTAASYSHKLTVRIGKVSHQATPVGLSFSSGNSDPRSSDYQKADVIPISCQFSKASATNGVENSMTFNAKPLMDERNQSKLMAELANSITTTCFNLLEDLNVKIAEKESNGNTAKPSWMPNVRVEVKEVKKVEATKAPVEEPKASVEPKNETSKAVTSEPTEENKTTKITQKVNEEGRKQIIIHNQGTPVIIQIGHERR